MSDCTVTRYLSRYCSGPSFAEVLPKQFKVKPSCCDDHLNHQTRICFFALNLILIYGWWEAHHPNLPLCPQAVFRKRILIGGGDKGSRLGSKGDGFKLLERIVGGREGGRGINGREEKCVLLRLYFLFTKLQTKMYLQLTSSSKRGRNPKSAPCWPL